jgi:hypothetical protein
MAQDSEGAWPGAARDDESEPEPGSAAPEESAEQREDHARLEAARRYFRAAPAYCIRFERDGRVSLRHKHLSTWGKTRPADATLWKVISHHADLEEAERRLRHITSVTVYYDARGQVVAWPEEGWRLPGEDEA